LCAFRGLTSLENYGRDFELKDTLNNSTGSTTSQHKFLPNFLNKQNELYLFNGGLLSKSRKQ